MREGKGGCELEEKFESLSVTHMYTHTRTHTHALTGGEREGTGHTNVTVMETLGILTIISEWGDVLKCLRFPPHGTCSINPLRTPEFIISSSLNTTFWVMPHTESHKKKIFLTDWK